MGVYITNLKMPTDGNETIIRIQPDGTVLDQYGHHLTITAAPVLPHGRLIDENEVRKLLAEMISLSNSIVNGSAILEWVADNLTQCQTIIPAEEGE